MTCELIQLGMQQPASSNDIIELMVQSLGIAREIEMANVAIVMVRADNTALLSRSCYTENKKAILALINSLGELRDCYIELYKKL